MKQIGLALHNYHDTHLSFPPLMVYATPGPTYTAYHHSWLTKIMPFMEQGPIYDMMDTNLPAWDVVNDKPMPFAQQQVATLQCPSDSRLKSTADSKGVAFTAYSAAESFDWWGDTCCAPNNNDPGWPPWVPYITKYPVLDGTHMFSGIFPNNKTHRIRDIRDGTSNTILFAEAFADCDGATRQTFRAANSHGFGITFDL